MKAIVVSEFGGAEQLRLAEAADPVPGQGQVRVAVHAAGVNPGAMRSWPSSGPIRSRRSASAPRLLMPPPRCWLAVPPFRSCPGWRSARAAGLLILGASGGVGLFLLQLAAAAGIETIAVGRRAMHDQMLGLGAAWCIDYASEDVGQRTISLAGGPVDAIADLVGGKYLAAVLPALRPAGQIAAIATPSSTSTPCSTPTSPSTACSSATTASEPGRWPRCLPMAPCGR